MITLSEENYLKAILSINLNKKSVASTNEIANTLNTSAASVTEMVKKLQDKKLVIYEKYKGVNLSSNGRKKAIEILRKHRLWETFLVKKLGFNWSEVHDVAEQLEHIKSKKLTDKLNRFLNYPKFYLILHSSISSVFDVNIVTIFEADCTGSPMVIFLEKEYV